MTEAGWWGVPMPENVKALAATLKARSIGGWSLDHAARHAERIEAGNNRERPARHLSAVK